MRMNYFLLLGSIFATAPALAADPRPSAAASAKQQAIESEARSPRPDSLMASDQLHARPSNKGRVRYTFPPATKRM